MFAFRKFKKECTVSTDLRGSTLIYIINHPDLGDYYAYSSKLDVGYRKAYDIVKNFRKANVV